MTVEHRGTHKEVAVEKNETEGKLRSRKIEERNWFLFLERRCGHILRSSAENVRSTYRPSESYTAMKGRQQPNKNKQRQLILPRYCTAFDAMARAVRSRGIKGSRDLKRQKETASFKP